MEDDEDDKEEEEEASAPAAGEGKSRARHDVFYLGSGSSKRQASTPVIEAAADVDNIPIAKLDLASGLLDSPAPKGALRSVGRLGSTSC